MTRSLWVTPTIKGEMCAYGLKDENGIIKCGIEKHYEGKSHGKPVGCHFVSNSCKQNKKIKKTWNIKL